MNGRKKQGADLHQAQPQPVERCFPNPQEGLSNEQVAHLAAAGWSNAVEETNLKSTGEIVRENTLTFFNLVFVVLAALLVLAFFPGIAYWASNLLGFQSPINFVYVVIIFLLLAKLFLLSIRVSQLDSRLRILTEQVALNQEKQESEKLDL